MLRICLILAAFTVVQGLAQDVAGYTLAEEGRYRITVHQVSCGPDAQPSPFGCRVHYSYRFENMSSVFIAGLGEVPASGEFDYVTKQSRITFLDSPDPDAVITFLDVNKTAATRGDPLPSFPAFRDFPPSPAVVGKLGQKGTFFDHAQRALTELFASRYDPDEMRNGVHYLITDYAEIKGPSPNLQVQVAVMISNPEPAPDATGFRIRWIVREKNKLEDEWRAPKSDSGSVASVNAFLNQLRSNIETPKK
jgi:hypothetical protein